MANGTQQRLDMTWYNKDKALIPTEFGKYEYMWVDPRDPRYCETRTLVMDGYVHGEQAPKADGVTYSERADYAPTTDNLLVLGESGDVLEALTRVPELNDKYVGQVRCIYIDPPFNTGEIFGESYEDNLEHSIWVTLMRDRLDHLHRLLSPEGSIWVHLDHKESHRMRMLLDARFGPGNFIAEIAWQKTDSARNDSTRINQSHDVILVYRKTARWTPNRLVRQESDNERFGSPDGDPNPWWPDNLTGKAPSVNRQHPGIYGIQHPVTGEMKYPAPGRGWVLHQDKMLEALSEYAPYRRADSVDVAERARRAGLPEHKIRDDVRDLVLAEPVEVARESALARYAQGNWPLIVLRGKGGAGGGLGRKAYIPTNGRVITSWWPNSEVGHNRAAKAEIKALFPRQAPFDTPKPERLLERIIHIATNPGDIVLDCFAGSGTTLAVAHKMGRRWVGCELQKPNFNRYTKPRLEAVVAGRDRGGVSVHKRAATERAWAPKTDAPDGDVTPTDAQAIESAFKLAQGSLTAPVDLAAALATVVKADQGGETPALDTSDAKDLLRLLTRLSRDGAATIDTFPLVKKAVTDQIKTVRLPDEVHWRGGGGFQVAHLGPACFDYHPDLGLVTLTQAAQDPETLRASVAANLRFHYTPQHRYFHGVRGSMRLYVTRDPLTPAYVTEIAGRLSDGESVTVASTVVLDGAAEALRTARRGSRIVHIPSDLFALDRKAQR